MKTQSRLPAWERKWPTAAVSAMIIFGQIPNYHLIWVQGSSEVGVDVHASNPICFCKSQPSPTKWLSGLPNCQFHLTLGNSNKETGKLRRTRKEEECWNSRDVLTEVLEFQAGAKSRLRNKHKRCYLQKLEKYNPIHATPLGSQPLWFRVGRKVNPTEFQIKQLKCKWALFRWIWTTEMVVPGLSGGLWAQALMLGHPTAARSCTGSGCPRTLPWVSLAPFQHQCRLVHLLLQDPHFPGSVNDCAQLQLLKYNLCLTLASLHQPTPWWDPPDWFARPCERLEHGGEYNLV